MYLCRFRFALGKPGEGIHSLRLFNVAIVDVLGTFLLAFVSSEILGGRYLFHLMFWFGMGMFLHWLFCVPTSVSEWFVGG